MSNYINKYCEVISQLSSFAHKVHLNKPSMNVDDAIAFIAVNLESVYSDLPDDSGGRTIFGVSSVNNPFDYNILDNCLTIGDLSNMITCIKRVYLRYEDHLMRRLLDGNNFSLYTILLSYAMWGRPYNILIKNIQSALNERYITPQLVADGYIGPNTVRVIDSLDSDTIASIVTSCLIDPSPAGFTAELLNFADMTPFTNGFINRHIKILRLLRYVSSKSITDGVLILSYRYPNDMSYSFNHHKFNISKIDIASDWKVYTDDVTITSVILYLSFIANDQLLNNIPRQVLDNSVSVSKPLLIKGNREHNVNQLTKVIYDQLS